MGGILVIGDDFEMGGGGGGGAGGLLLFYGLWIVNEMQSKLMSAGAKLQMFEKGRSYLPFSLKWTVESGKRHQSVI